MKTETVSQLERPKLKRGDQVDDEMVPWTYHRYNSDEEYFPNNRDWYLAHARWIGASNSTGFWKILDGDCAGLTGESDQREIKSEGMEFVVFGFKFQSCCPGETHRFYVKGIWSSKTADGDVSPAPVETVTAK